MMCIFVDVMGIEPTQCPSAAPAIPVDRRFNPSVSGELFVHWIEPSVEYVGVEPTLLSPDRPYTFDVC